MDYRDLNNRTVKDNFPLPNIQDCLDSLAGSTFFSTLDMASGYYQIELEESDKKKMAIVIRYGLFEYNRMDFGLQRPRNVPKGDTAGIDRTHLEASSGLFG